MKHTNLDIWDAALNRITDRQVPTLDQAIDRLHNGIKLALPNPYRLLYRQSGRGRECVVVKLLENEVTPFATYDLSGEDPEGRRYCVRGAYCFTLDQAKDEFFKRTGTYLVVA